MLTEIGARVGAMESADEKQARMYGFGKYEGMVFNDALGIQNPKITLDDGNVVWGYQCWWGPEDRVKQMIGKREVVMSPSQERPAMADRSVTTMSLDEFVNTLKAQGVKREDLAFVCPACKTIQSARDLIKHGAGKTFDEVEKYLAFSCVGRFTGAPSPRKNPDGKPCNWTLGGFFHAHTLEVVTPDGEHHPRFEPATREQAVAHAAEVANG